MNAHAFSARSFLSSCPNSGVAQLRKKWLFVFGSQYFYTMQHGWMLSNDMWHLYNIHAILSNKSPSKSLWTMSGGCRSEAVNIVFAFPTKH